MTKTLFIYSNFENLPKYFIKEGDYSRFNSLIAGTTGVNEKENKLTEELEDFLDEIQADEMKEFTTSLVIEVDFIVNVGYAM